MELDWRAEVNRAAPLSTLEWLQEAVQEAHRFRRAQQQEAMDERYQRIVRLQGRPWAPTLFEEAALHRQAGHHLPLWRRVLLRLIGGRP